MKIRTMTSIGDLEDSIFLHESDIRGHYVFKDVWTPHLGEILLVEKEPGNSHDRCVVESRLNYSWTCTKRVIESILALSQPQLGR